MRLIDADVFKEIVGTDTKLRRMVCELIDSQPTAYDVDKVLEQLEEESFDGLYGRSLLLYDADRIVCNGGKE